MKIILASLSGRSDPSIAVVTARPWYHYHLKFLLLRQIGCLLSTPNTTRQQRIAHLVSWLSYHPTNNYSYILSYKSLLTESNQSSSAQNPRHNKIKYIDIYNYHSINNRPETNIGDHNENDTVIVEVSPNLLQLFLQFTPGNTTAIRPIVTILPAIINNTRMTGEI